MDAVDTHPGSADPVVAQPGDAADAWFRALDGLPMRIGTASCMTQVVGIHGNGSELWIQLACADNPELSVVIHVGSATRIEDVIERLKNDPPTGHALEIISFTTDPDQAVADAQALARAARRPH